MPKTRSDLFYALLSKLALEDPAMHRKVQERMKQLLDPRLWPDPKARPKWAEGFKVWLDQEITEEEFEQRLREDMPGVKKTLTVILDPAFFPPADRASIDGRN